MKGKYFLGIILILIGGGFLLDQFNIIVFGDIFSLYWPSLLILLGLLGFLDRRSSKFGNLLLMIIGGMLQVDKLDLLDVNVFKLVGPIVLILIGINVIFSRTKIYVDKNSFKKTNFTGNLTSEDILDETAIMSGIDINNQSLQFKGGKATAIMGGIDIDLREATLNNNEATIEINAIMGGIDIKVPDNWRVEVSGTPIMGGVSNKTRSNNDQNAPLLRISYFVMLGGIEIK